MALSDSFARSQAAQSMIGALGGGGAPEEMVPPEMAEEEMAAPPSPDLETSLAGVEAALAEDRRLVDAERLPGLDLCVRLELEAAVVSEEMPPVHHNPLLFPFCSERWPWLVTR